jgi:hypothetical protein
MDVDMIPIDLDGDFDPTNMDIWLNKRLKFEVFWEDCRMCYKRLQFLPQTLQRIFKEVSKSVWDVKQKYSFVLVFHVKHYVKSTIAHRSR